ncbi:MAG: hypothetical protein JWL71_731 [Acidobacteria bacterium]|nr:hypothetical protein [Acidobacteriota bacterium]
MRHVAAAIISIICLSAGSASAQAPGQYPPAELDRLVSRIALYPDPLLAQILAASTFPEQTADASRWADEHHYMSGEPLARAIADDHLPFDPSVQALLPFPSVLNMMAADMPWTTSLGNAFLDQPQDVTDAAQRLRQQARDYGYLRSNAQVTVSPGPYVEILPAAPGYVVVPYYDPLIVFARPRPGYRPLVAIRYGYTVPIGVYFSPWGWGGNRIAWSNRAVFINNARWDRSRINRQTYVHPYAVPRYAAPRPADPHRAVSPSGHEREQERRGERGREEHKREERKKPEDRNKP